MFLTYTRFTGNQYRQVCGSDLHRHLNITIQQRRVANDAETLFDGLNFVSCHTYLPIWQCKGTAYFLNMQINKAKNLYISKKSRTFAH